MMRGNRDKVRRLPRLRRLLAHDAGATLIEFGIVAPVVLLFITGMVDLAGGLAEKHRLKQVVDRALERAQASPRDSSFTYVETEAAAAAGPGSQVVMEQWLECDTNRRTIAEGCDTGQSSRFIKLTVTSSYRPLFRMDYFGVRDDGTVAIIAKGTLRVR